MSFTMILFLVYLIMGYRGVYRLSAKAQSIWQTHSLSQLKIEFNNSTYGSCTKMNRSCKVNRERRCIL